MVNLGLPALNRVLLFLRHTPWPTQLHKQFVAAVVVGPVLLAHQMATKVAQVVVVVVAEATWAMREEQVMRAARELQQTQQPSIASP
jgi:hypothetical protein